MSYSRSGFFACAARITLVSLFAGATAATARAQTDTPPDPASQPGAGLLCVTLNTITNGQILNGHEMRFELRDGTELLATLARDCPQLKFHDRFSYQAVAGRLCAGEGHIVARSGEACMISSFSLAPKPAEAPVEAPDNPSSESQ